MYTNLDDNTTKVEFIDNSGLVKFLEENHVGYGNLLNCKDNDMQNKLDFSKTNCLKIV